MQKLSNDEHTWDKIRAHVVKKSLVLRRPLYQTLYPSSIFPYRAVKYRRKQPLTIRQPRQSQIGRYGALAHLNSDGESPYQCTALPYVIRIYGQPSAKIKKYYRIRY